MSAKKINLILEQGTDFEKTIPLYDENGIKLNLTDYTAFSLIKKSPNSSVSYPFIITFVDRTNGEIKVSMAKTDTSKIEGGRYVYDIILTDPDDNTKRAIEGNVLVTPGVSLTREENKSGNDQLIRYDLATQQWNTNGVGINTTSNVGIGTTNPTEKLTVGGNILLNQTTLYGSVQASTASTIATGIHSGLSTSVYRSVEYTIRASEGSNYQMVKILAIHNGTTAYDTQYGNIYNTEVASFDVDISGGNVRLVAIASSTSTTNYTVNFIATKI